VTAATATAALLCIGAPALADAGGDAWPSAGHDLKNSRYAATETQISAKTVGSLHLKWAVTTDGDVTANPAVDAGSIYFGDSAGSLYRVDRSTGKIVWKSTIAGYTGIAGDNVRATPTLAGNLLIMGNQAGKLTQWTPAGPTLDHPAQVFAVDKNTGELVWRTTVDDTAYAMATHSPIVAKGKVFVGIASNEELWSGLIPKAAWQWTFRGSVVALDVATGKLLWKTYTVPAGYYGGSVWGSTGAVDLQRNQLYMATGNNFWAPDSARDCAATAIGNHANPLSCLAADDHFDSVIALDLDTGRINWGSRGLPYDVWNVGCGLSIPGVFEVPANDNCPYPKGPDWDFAQGPMLFGGNANSNAGRLVGAGQKSGMYWAFDADTGAQRWSTQAGPPGLTGGLQWGSATDGQRVFVAISNSGLRGAGQDTLAWPQKGGGTSMYGGWSALNVNSGAVMWTTKDPLDSRAEGAVSAANDVVFGCNLDPARGTMYAMDAKTGKLLWSYDSGPPTYTHNFYTAACGAGPSIADGMVFWGSGTFQGYGPKRVFAFGL
jgi:polyvinyl alcohol dehydrogenase (cytochrome)